MVSNTLLEKVNRFQETAMEGIHGFRKIWLTMKPNQPMMFLFFAREILILVPTSLAMCPTSVP